MMNSHVIICINVCNWFTHLQPDKLCHNDGPIFTVYSFDPFWLAQFRTFPHHWTVSLAKHSPMTFTNVLENLITVHVWNTAVMPLLF